MNLPERPIECSNCNKEISVFFTQIAKDKTSKQGMCSSCPKLELLVYGSNKSNSSNSPNSESSLSCGCCKTTLNDIKISLKFGCKDCYSTFSSFLINSFAKEFNNNSTLNNTSAQSLHSGRRPREVVKELNPILRVIALNEALDETLIREDYEQAALLRDQIKALKNRK